jgi:ABC-2 type transport system ATP-binding protein
MPPASPAILAEHLRKHFGATVAVDDVSFEVARGEVVGFLGPNGAGKSTTLRMLTGVFPPSSGRVTIAGFDVVREPLEARQRLGYLPERTALYGDMAVAGYLAFVAELKRVPQREVVRAVAAAMDAVAIDHVAHRLVGNLSKGYRQRVGIAQAILGDPPVLVLDEPTSGLDPEQVSDIRTLIRGLGAERTVILSTHILPEVESVCSRVMVMNRGRILAVDEPGRLEQRLRPHAEILVRVQGSDEAVVAAIRAVPGVVEVLPRGRSADGLELAVRSPHGADVRREVAAAVVGCGFGLVEMRPVSMTLEEIFLALVSDGGPPGGSGIEAGAPAGAA